MHSSVVGRPAGHNYNLWDVGEHGFDEIYDLIAI
jgi:hypothetical protein